MSKFIIKRKDKHYENVTHISFAYIEQILLANVFTSWMINWLMQYLFGFRGSESCSRNTVNFISYASVPISFSFFLNMFMWVLILNYIVSYSKQIKRIFVINLAIITNVLISLMFCTIDLRSTYCAFNNNTKPDEMLMGLFIGIVMGFIALPFYMKAIHK